MGRKYNLDSDVMKDICKNMYEAISLAGQFAYNLEEKELYEELDILKQQTACCYRVLADTFNALEIGRYRLLDPVELDISQYIADLVDCCRNKIRDTKIQLLLESDAKGAVVYVDTERLTACLLNILVNALANVDLEEGVVKVSLKSSVNMVTIKIMDNGYGLNAANAADYMTEDVGGGLYILKLFCDAFNGSYLIEGSENGGTCVAIRIPILPPAFVVHSSRRRLRDGTFSPPNILMSKLRFAKIDAFY